MYYKKSKYGNKKTVVDGITFDSKAEARRYGELKILYKSGKISDLHLQISLPIVYNGKKICKYIADFVYTENGSRVYEDVKGVKTSVYNLKKKLVKAFYEVDIRETK